MNILGVNAGNGVLLYPMKDHVVGNIEIRPIFHTKGLEQWKANFSQIPYYKSVAEARTGIKTPIDVIVGNPDCGHSSVLSYSRRKALSDPRDNKSLELFVKCVKKFEPYIFMMENLPKLLEICDSTFWGEILPNYAISYNTQSVSQWGNSQKTRVRLVMVGVRTDIALLYENKLQYHFMDIYKVNEIKTTGELLSGVNYESIDFGHVREDINSIITLYAGFKISLKDAQRIWQEDPESTRWTVKDRKFSTAPGVYRNPGNKYPSTARKSNRQFNPQGLQMSPRELARIQGVPDDFKIVIKDEDIQYWINKGRATIAKGPPHQIGQWFYKQLLTTNVSWK